MNVTASLTFLANRSENNVYIPSVAGKAQSLDQAEGKHVVETVPVRNARAASCSLTTHGFQLVDHQVQEKFFCDDDNFDVTAYHAQVKALLLAHIEGATRVEIFDDTRRSASASARLERKMREPSANVHNDYTNRSGHWRLQGYLEEKYPNDEDTRNELLQKRFWIVNCWRSTRGTIVNWPLVLCDKSTVDPSDIVAVERKSADRKGEIQMALFQKQQCWYYFPHMTTDEALLIHTFDSFGDCFTIHSSFDDPTAPINAPPRESIETRCFVFF